MINDGPTLKVIDVSQVGSRLRGAKRPFVWALVIGLIAAAIAILLDAVFGGWSTVSLIPGVVVLIAPIIAVAVTRRGD